MCIRDSAATVRAVLGTTSLAYPQTLRAMYQVHDAEGNTLVQSGASTPHLTYQLDGDATVRTVPCYAVGALSGVGECYGSLVAAAFDSAVSVPLSLEWTSAATGDQITLASFGTVATQRRPTWSQAGGWDLGEADTLVYVDAGKAVAFGAELPYEDVFIPPSASDGRGAFDVSIHMKTHMDGATEAARQVDVGKFKLLPG